jgi:hypothetical protein
MYDLPQTITSQTANSGSLTPIRQFQNDDKETEEYTKFTILNN